MSSATAFLFAAIATAVVISGDASQEKPPAATAGADARTFTVAWRKRVSISGSPRLAVGTRAIFLATAETGLSAFALDDGRELWGPSGKTDLGPVVLGNRIAVVSDRSLEVLEQDTGNRAWRADLEGADAPIRLDSVDQLIAVGSGREIRTWRAGGSPNWRTTLSSAPVTRVIATTESWLMGLEQPEIVALDPASGAIKWRGRLPARPLSMSVAGSNLFLSAADNAVYSFDLEPRLDRKWRHRRLMATVGDPVADDDHAYFTFIDNTLRAYSRDGGTRRWTHPLPSRPLTGPLLIGGAVVVALASGEVVRVSAATGREAQPDRKREPSAGRASVAVAAQQLAAVFAVVSVEGGASELVAWRLSEKARQP